MVEGPQWQEISEDEALHQAVANADQETGEGMQDLLNALIAKIPASDAGGVVGFEWHQEQGEQPQGDKNPPIV